MPILTVPTFSQQILTIRQRILAYRTDISLLPGSVAGDLFVTPQALSDVQMFAVIFYDSCTRSVADLLALENNQPTLALIATALGVQVSDVLTDISNSLDTMGNNVGVPREQPKNATGEMTIGAPLMPTGADSVIPAGTTARSSSGQLYTTTAAATMYVGNAITYYDPNLGLFDISIPAQAVTAGSAGNAAEETLVALVTPVPGLPLVTNITPFADGADLESDADYGARILLKWQSLGAVTQAGVVLNTETLAGISSEYLARPGTTYATRGIGKADLYIKDVAEVQVTETFYAYNSPLFADGIRPSQQPVRRIVSASSGTPFLVNDTSSVIQGSVRSQDTIRFSVAPNLVTGVTVVYTINQRVADAQNVFASGQYSPYNYLAPTSDATAVATPLLVKQAPGLSVDYTAAITAVPGYVKSQVVAAIQAALATFSSALVIGQQVFVSDVNAVVLAVPGVLRLTGDPTKFAPTTSSGVLNSITPAVNQYVYLGNINIF